MKKKILMIANLYVRGISGENISFINEYKILSDSELFDIKLMSIERVFKPLKMTSNYINFILEFCRFRPDIVYLHNPIPVPSLWFILFLRKTKVVFVHHNMRFVCPIGIPIRNQNICINCANNSFSFLNRDCRSSDSLFYFVLYTLPYRIVSRKTNLHSIVLNNFMFRTMNSVRPSKNIVFFPNLFPNSDEKARISKSTDEFIIFWAGRQHFQKGYRELLNLKSVSHLPFVLKIAGELDESFKDELKMEIGNCIKIEFLGIISNNEVLKILASANLLLFTSLLYEGFPSIIVEAMLCGTPCLSSNFFGIENFPEKGLMIYNNTEDFTQCFLEYYRGFKTYNYELVSLNMNRIIKVYTNEKLNYFNNL